MSLLRRHHAPILDEAWRAIDEEAQAVLSDALVGRKLVDFSGPHGWSKAAVNTGALQAVEACPVEGVELSQRIVDVLVEVRAPFSLSIANLDRVGRGGEPDLDAVVEAARKIALTEDKAVFQGLGALDRKGIVTASPHEPVSVSGAAGYPRAILEAIERLKCAGVDGPYGLALGAAAYDELMATRDEGYPINKQVRSLIAGPIVRAEAVEEAVVMSLRGDDYELVVGQDLSIGYADRDGDTVHLFIVESFVFRVRDEGAAVPLARG